MTRKEDRVSELEQAVIKAARKVRDWDGGSNVEALIKAVDALDESLRPDLWQIIETVSNTVGRLLASRVPSELAGVMSDVEKALEWRREHGE